MHSGDFTRSQAHSRCRTFAEDFATEAEKFCRSATRLRRELSGTLDESLILHQPTEVLLVQSNAGNRLDGSLEFQKRE